MSTKYTDSSPVVVSPEPRRSSCSCVMTGCGCIIVVLIALAVGLALLWPRIERGFAEFVTRAAEQFARVYQEEATRRVQSDPRVIEKLGRPVTVTADPGKPFRFDDPKFHMQLEGPNGKATATAIGVKEKNNRIEFERIEVVFADGSKIDVMEVPTQIRIPLPDQEPAPADSIPPPLDTLYRATITLVRSDETLKSRLGEDIRVDWIRGEIEASRATWDIGLHGSTGQAKAVVKGESDGSAWKVTNLEVTFDNDETLQLPANGIQPP